MQKVFYRAKAELVQNGRYYFDKRVLSHSNIHQWVQADEYFRPLSLKLIHRNKGGGAIGAYRFHEKQVTTFK